MFPLLSALDEFRHLYFATFGQPVLGSLYVHHIVLRGLIRPCYFSRLTLDSCLVVRKSNRGNGYVIPLSFISSAFDLQEQSAWYIFET